MSTGGDKDRCNEVTGGMQGLEGPPRPMTITVGMALVCGCAARGVADPAERQNWRISRSARARGAREVAERGVPKAAERDEAAGGLRERGGGLLTEPA